MTVETLGVPTGATGAGGREPDRANLCLAFDQGSSAFPFHISGFRTLDFI